jgi:hypothetical protein
VNGYEKGQSIFAEWYLPIPGLSVMKLLFRENVDGDQIPERKSMVERRQGLILLTRML